jgi:hypothetical protein
LILTTRCCRQGGIQVSAYAAPCGPSCPPKWTAASDEPLAGVMNSFGLTPVVSAQSGGIAFVAPRGVVYRMPADPCTGDSQHDCAAAWVADVGEHDWTDIRNVNEVLFVSSQYSGSLFAYSAACLAVREDCQPIWSTGGVADLTAGVMPPVIDGQTVYLVGGGVLYAFAPVAPS